MAKPEPLALSLPRWRSHKSVQAARIVEWKGTAFPVLVEVADPDGGPATYVEITVPKNFDARGMPSPGCYLVIYDDGYMSWSPAKAFEEGYTLIEDAPPRFDIGQAIEHLHRNRAVSRLSWAGNRMLVLVPGSSFRVELDRPLGRALPRLTGMPVNYRVHIDVLEVTTNTLSPWQPTTEDVMAEDWLVMDLAVPEA